MMESKKSGILLHISSLPSKFGIGDLGAGAYKFVDFLADSKQSFWQILPIHPTDLLSGNSPYSCPSTFACNTLLISPELLLEDGFIGQEDLQDIPDFSLDRVDFIKAAFFKHQLFDKVFQRFKKNKKEQKAFVQFQKDQAAWLDDYSVFLAIKDHCGGIVWTDWPDELKERIPEGLEQFCQEHQDAVTKIQFLQYLFFSQWAKLRAYCAKRKVQIIGDIPIYVNFDSADVWTHRDIFKLNKKLKPSVVAGVPPDYFSKTGQRWGNPVYNWDQLKATGFSWWIARLEHILNLCDVVRVDHFRAFINYWEIPAKEKTAVNGYWVDVPTEHFFASLSEHFKDLPLIAEDLGDIDSDVRARIEHLGYPGMKILLFAFGEDLEHQMYLPHNYNANCVVYPGTHDNNTVEGWFRDEAGQKEKENFSQYVLQRSNAEDCALTKDKVHWQMIALAMSSPARLAIAQLQDVLGLGSASRMNKPGTGAGNWTWRASEEEMNSKIIEQLKEMTEICRRG